MASIQHIEKNILIDGLKNIALYIYMIYMIARNDIVQKHTMFRPSSNKDDFNFETSRAERPTVVQGPTEPAISTSGDVAPKTPTPESPAEMTADVSGSTELDSEEFMVPISPENVEATSDAYHSLGGEGEEDSMKELVDPLYAYLHPRVPQIMYDPEVADSQLPPHLQKEAEAWLKEHRKHQARWAEATGETGTAVDQVVHVSDDEEVSPRNLEKEFEKVENSGPGKGCSAGLLFDK